MQRPAFLDDAAFSRIASEFLSEHNPSGVVPVPIETIVEFGLEIAIVPTAGLMDKHGGLNAFITRDKTEIWVDAGLFEQDGSRYRFSLAHEIAHLLLKHDELLAEFQSVEDWVEYFRDLPEGVYMNIEFQANRVANHIVVPQEGLKEKFDSYISSFSEEALPLAKQDACTTLLAREYAVSEATMQRALKYIGALQYPGL